MGSTNVSLDMMGMHVNVKGVPPMPQQQCQAVESPEGGTFSLRPSLEEVHSWSPQSPHYTTDKSILRSWNMHVD